MQEYIRTDKPLVSILMAVYKPNEKWLREQLFSLNQQTYTNLMLLIYDDCPDIPLDETIVQELITAFPYRIIRGEKNYGSNKAFERLTLEGEGKYFSYCDQDDVWHKNKIQRMVDVLEETNSPMVCSDLAIIDHNGKKIADSITKYRKRHIFIEEDSNMASRLLVKSFVTGCAMMMRSDTAKSSIPFVDSLIHDQWLAINAALEGKIEIIREPLIDYRQHGNNQTGVLVGVKTKQDYFKLRIMNMSDRLNDYRIRLLGRNALLDQTISEISEFNEARIRYFNTHHLADLKIIWKYKKFSKEGVALESLMPFLPPFVLRWIFELIHRRII